MRNSILTAMICGLFCGVGSAQQNSSDRFFVVASKNRKVLTNLGAPSVNDRGDLVLRLISGTVKTHEVCLGEDQLNPANQPGVVPLVLVRSSSGTLSTYPVLNNNRSVVSYNYQSSIQTVSRYDYSNTPSPQFFSARIARADAAQTQPFAFLSPIADLDDSGNVFFYGERQPVVGSYNRRIYSSAVEVTSPALKTPVASSPDVFSQLETYLAASRNGHVVYRGSLGGEAGIYRESANLPVGVPGRGFPATGGRPSINNSGTVAFSGTLQSAGSLPGVFLQYATETSARFAGNLADLSVSAASGLFPNGTVPSSYDFVNRVALNDFNQVAFLGTDSNNRQALFTTALGSLRRLIGAGDPFYFNGESLTVSSLALYDGLGTNGQLAFWAALSNGDEVIARANRGYTQTKLLDSPISPSYKETFYLLRSVPGSGFAATKRIRAVGCNLTSTANLLGYYGADISPASYQNWLTANWQSASAIEKPKYISADNDLVEKEIEEYSRYLFYHNLAPRVVSFVGVHRTAQGSNLQKIISELRHGRAVKLRVPNGHPPLTANYQAYGHYVLAYGLVDPSKADATMGKADILIMDPGNGGVYTLAAYGAKGYDEYAANWLEEDWLEDDKRVYLYREVTPITLPLHGLDITLRFGRSAAAARVAPKGAPGSPELILEDPNGRRVGIDSLLGELNEIPGAQYVEEDTYYSLDDGVDAFEPVWPHPSVKHLWLEDAAPGQYRLEIVAGASCSFQIDLQGFGALALDTTALAGSLSAGERRAVSVATTHRPAVFEPPIRLPNGHLGFGVNAPTGGTLVVESSTNLVSWAAYAVLPNSNGFVQFEYNNSNNVPQRFFRAR